MIVADDPVSCAMYAKEAGLLELPGWQQFKRIVHNEKRMKRMLNQARLKSIRRAPKYKYGFQVPCDFREAVLLDKRNGNT